MLNTACARPVSLQITPSRVAHADEGQERFCSCRRDRFRVEVAQVEAGVDLAKGEAKVLNGLSGEVSSCTLMVCSIRAAGVMGAPVPVAPSGYCSAVLFLTGAPSLE